MNTELENMQIISNQRGPRHSNIINQLIEQSDGIIFCIAFLKLSGLDSIIDKLKSKVGNSTFFIGTDYYLTEPNALRKLLKQGHNVFITKKNKSTFHPKIYYFKSNNNISILAGSANLTGGGLEGNFEISLLIKTIVNTAIDNDFKTIMNIYKENSILLSELLISQYEREYETYRRKHKKADNDFNDELKQVHKLDLSKLKKYANEYLQDKDAINGFGDRTNKYKTAKNKLDAIAKLKINSPSDFLSYYEDIAKSFHSSGLLRGKTIFAKKYKTILEIIKLVKQNDNVEPKRLFSEALLLVKSVKRYGVNALTEVMNTYNPIKYSVINGRTLKSLSKLGFAGFPSANSFGEDSYERYNNLIKGIAEDCEFKNLGQVDHFLSWYYDKYVPKKKNN